MSLNLEQKQAAVAEISAEVAKAQAIVLAEYRSLPVGDMTALRKSARCPCYRSTPPKPCLSPLPRHTRAQLGRAADLMPNNFAATFWLRATVACEAADPPRPAGPLPPRRYSAIRPVQGEESNR